MSLEGKPKKTAANIFDDAKKWLSQRESEWALDNKSISLLAEDPIDEVSLKWGRFYLGAIYKQAVLSGQKWRVDAFFTEYETVIAKIVVGIGYRSYENGNFWDGFWESTRIAEKFQNDRFGGKSKADISSDWGKAFLAFLEKHHLPSFPGHPQKYVVPILLHAGIPISCLQNYFVSIDRALNVVGYNAEAITHYLSDEELGHSYGVNKPIIRFLKNGGEFAVEFVDRSIEALAKISREENLEGHPLPPEVLEAAQEFYSDDLAKSANRLNSKKALNSGKIQILLNVAYGNLDLVLPEIESKERTFNWNINLDDLFSQVQPRVVAGGHFLRRQSHMVSLDRPVRRLGISNSDGSVQRDTILYDSNFPAIFFSIDGELIPRNSTLPKGVIYLLTAKSKLKGFEDSNDWVQQEIPPLGWADWDLFRLDLSDQSNLKVFSDEPALGVATKIKASIQLNNPVPGLFLSGQPVYSRTPKILIPSGEGAKWQIGIRAIGGTDKTNTIEIVGSKETQTLDAFNSEDSAILGLFEINVRGPLGFGASATVAIAYNVEINRDEVWRRFGEFGLEAHRAEITSKSFSIEPEQIFLESQELSAAVTFKNSENTAVLTYTPPAMAIAERRNGIPQPWQHGALVINNENLRETELMLRIPENFSKMELSVVSEGLSQQTISTSIKQNPNILNFELHNIESTMDRLRLADLYLDFGALGLRVARVEPRDLFTDYEATKYDISLGGYAGGKVNAHIWSVYEIWREPVLISIPDGGRFPIPSDLVGLGDLVIQFERVNPWSHSTLGELPELTDSYRLEIQPDMTKLSVEGQALCYGKRDLNVRLKKLGNCWRLLIAANRLSQGDFYDLNTVSILCSLVREEPVRALEVLSQIQIDTKEAFLAITTSGILMSALPRDAKSQLNDGEIASRLRRSPIAMAIPTISTLMRTKSVSHFPQTWTQVRTIFGSPFEQIATTGLIPNVSSGGFAGMEKVLDQNPESADAYVALTGAYPREILDRDTRMIAGLDLFKKREAFKETSRAANLKSVLAEIQKPFADKYPEIHKMIKLRYSEGESGWKLLSGISLALAFLNRANARGLINATSKCISHSDLIREFSIQAFDLFSSDLILADLYICSLDEHYRPEFPVNDAESEQ